MRNNVLEKLKYYKIALFWISAGLLFWILDAFIDAFIFHQDTAFHQLSQPSLQGIYIRSLVFMACTIFGLYYQALINRYRKTQDVLHRKEEKYQDLYNNAPDMFASVEAATGKIIQCNETLAKALGYTKEEIISRHITYVYHPDCEKDRKRVFQSFVQTGEVRNVQLQLKRKHGSKIDVSLSVSAVHDSKGKVLYSRSIWRDISEQKKSEESLRKSEERFDLVSKATNDGIWDRTSFENEEAWWSPRWYELLGYQNGEIKASHRQFASLVHPDDLEGMSKALRDHMEKQLPFDIELRLKTKSGVFKWFQARGQAVWDEKGKPVRIAGSIQDISERKRAEGALRESETLFRTLSSLAPIGIFQTNAEGDCTYANKHWQTISGQTLEESLGNGWSKAIHPDDREVLLKEWAKAVRQGQEFTFEYRIITPQGETRWAHGHVTAISSNSGNLTGYVGTLEDITERKEKEAEIKRLKEYNENIVASIPTAILTCDQELKVKTVNQASCELFHQREQDIVGSHLSKILGPDVIHKEKLDQRILEVLKIKEPSEEMEIKYNFPKIGDKVLSLKIVGISHEEGEEGEVLFLIDDMTEKRELQEGIRQADRLASIGQMAAGLAHEINNPLAIIKGNAQYMRKIMQRKKFPSSQKKDFSECMDVLEKIVEEEERCAKIISGLLEFSRKDENKVSPLDINDEIVAVLAVAAHNLSLNNIKTAQKLSPDLPSVLGNPDQLRQVFMNMILNAQDAMPGGGDLTIETFHRHGDIAISFTDTGCGISKRAMSKLFDPFFTTKKPGKGVGLGLSVSHGIITAHKGTVDVKSKIGSGATFTVQLPVMENAEV